MASILVVDDQEMMRDSLEATLSRAGHKVAVCGGGYEALEKIKQRSFDVIISDLKMPKMDGLTFLDELGKLSLDVPVLMMTAYATIKTAVSAMRKGAFDYIQKPFDADEITLLIERTLEHRQLVKENEAYRTNARDWQRGRQLIGNSEVMKKVMEKVKQVAQSSATVLVRGESGTGKELIARAIHAQSRCNDKPMLCVNCAALSSTLLESELFGHEKGAFTGAERMRKGRFELADGGTLLLDEISEMDFKLQAKLLRVLQEREFERVGSSITRQVNVRVITTTNRNLEEMVREGKFREDLFYRLNVVPIFLPPLRERLVEDLESLCEYFLRRCADRDGREVRILSKAAMEVLNNYYWPGNVRELENLMERISILGTAELITAEAIRNALELGQIKQATPVEAIENQDMLLADLEKQIIQKTLAKYDGHRQKTARSLGIGVRTLGMKLKRWKMEESCAK
ncbi:sigma-54-dependent transcriptional regulator [Planctomycetota bacterium]